MSEIFPKWTNKLPSRVIVGAIIVGAAVTIGASYYLTPKYSRVGYQPIQPVAFSHAIHADQLGVDCRYCHNGVEKSWYSNVPASSVCMNCHKQVLPDAPQLEPVRRSVETGEPIAWVQIHKLPDYVYFNHSVHVNRGISCVSCHGQINKMDEVFHSQSFTMLFCLDCHRAPENNIRDPKGVYNLDLVIPRNQQLENGKQFVHDWKVNASQNCSACHR